VKDNVLPRWDFGAAPEGFHDKSLMDFTADNNEL